MNFVKSWGVAFNGPGAFRLFLASVVVVHHSFPFRAGSWAVYVFFILSGYWITKMWHGRYSRTRNSYLTFLVSRWWRLAPVFFVCTILGICSALLLRDRLALTLLVDPTWWLRQIPIAGSAMSAQILPPSWSLDAEMQFYLVAPLSIFLISRAPEKARWPIVAMLVLLLSSFVWLGCPVEAPFFPLFAGFFIAGIVLASGNWIARNSTILAGIAALLIGIAVLFVFPETRSSVWREGSANAAPTNLGAVWWVLGAILVVPFVSKNVRVRSSRFDRFLGNLAYPLYLFHWIPREWYYHLSETGSHGWSQIVYLLANFASAFIGAIAILVLIDQPLDRLRTRWVTSREQRLKAGESGESAAINPAPSSAQAESSSTV
jgi:peptidoglycan/LPS O-acetylase OafA/YrhL